MKIVSCATYIFCGDNILIGKRGYTAPNSPNKWNVPTGYVDDGEEPIESAVREVYEETGLRIPQNLFTDCGVEQWGIDKAGKNYVVILPKDRKYKIGNGDGENSKFQWVPVSEINQLSFAFQQDKNILRFFNKKINENKTNIMKIKKSQLIQLIKEEVGRRLLNEATPQQIALMKDIFGAEKYDNWSGKDTFEQSDKSVAGQAIFLARKKFGEPKGKIKMATPKQIDFIKNNKWHQLPWIDKIKKELTKDEATELCNALCPFQGNVNMGGFNIRTVKNIWIPQRTQVIVKIATAHGLNTEAAQEQADCNAYFNGLQATANRVQQRKKNAKLKNAEIVVYPSTNTKIKLGKRLTGAKTFGTLKQNSGVDTCNIKDGYQSKFYQMIRQLSVDSMVTATCRLEGYSEPCKFILWRVDDDRLRKFAGIIIDEDDTTSENSAKIASKSKTCKIK